MLHKVKSARQGPESESDVARWVRSTFTLGAVRVPQLHHSNAGSLKHLGRDSVIVQLPEILPRTIKGGYCSHFLSSPLNYVID